MLPLPARAGAALLVLTAAAACGWTPALPSGGAWLRRTAAGVLATSVVGALVVVPAGAASAAAEPSSVAPCTAGQQQRSYAISAATVDVPFNRWGDTLKSARIFALNQDLPAIRNWSRPLNADAALDPAKNRRLRPRPLVLRANEGECVQVTLTNRMGAAAGHGLTANPRVGISASGMVVDARTARRREGRLRRRPDRRDRRVDHLLLEGPGAGGPLPVPGHGDPRRRRARRRLARCRPVRRAWPSSPPARSGPTRAAAPCCPARRATRPRVYKAVSTQSGELYVEADIHPPNGPSFRESVQLAQDEITGIGMGFNYGSEAMVNRESRACPDCLGEETWLSSWPYGDPALVKLASGPGPWLPGTGADRKEKEDCGLPESCFVSNVFHTYNGDATKIRFGLSGREGDPRLPPARPPVARRPPR